MRLTAGQIYEYQERGLLRLDGLFTDAELNEVRSAAQMDLDSDTPRRVSEAGSDVVRATHGAHLTVPFFQDLVRLPRLLELARDVLGGDVYVHQFKINAKAAMRGENWEWHQDFFFWQHEDGMPGSSALNIVLHLDEVSEFNGPLFLIPRSHHAGEIPAEQQTADLGTGSPEPGVAPDFEESSDWRTTVSAKLKYKLDPDALRALVEQNGIESVKAAPGSALLFHPAVVHGSSSNLSPFDRRLLILSYNLCTNQLRDVPSPRPDFLASRVFAPLEPLADDVLPPGSVPVGGNGAGR